MQREILSLYSAAIGEESWEITLGKLLESLGADAMLLGAGDLRAPDDVEVWSSGDHASAHIEVGYTDAESWTADINPCVAAGAMTPVGRTFDFRKLIPEDVIARSEFIQTTMAKYGHMASRGFAALRDGPFLAGGYIARQRNKEFDQQDIERFDSIIPHIGQALRLRTRLARHRAIENSLSALLDTLHAAVFLVDDALRVLFVNAVAEEIAARGQDLTVTRNRLTLPVRVEVAALKAIASFADPERGASPVSLALRQPSAPPSYLLRIFPGSGWATLPGAHRVAAVIFAEPLGDGPDLPEIRDLTSAFDLTEREAAVARLVPTGQSRRAIGSALGISENTVKTHLAAILEKTGARNATELAFLLSRLVR